MSARRDAAVPAKFYGSGVTPHLDTSRDVRPPGVSRCASARGNRSRRLHFLVVRVGAHFELCSNLEARGAKTSTGQQGTVLFKTHQ